MALFSPFVDTRGLLPLQEPVPGLQLVGDTLRPAQGRRCASRLPALPSGRPRGVGGAALPFWAAVRGAVGLRWGAPRLSLSGGRKAAPVGSRSLVEREGVRERGRLGDPRRGGEGCPAALAVGGTATRAWEPLRRLGGLCPVRGCRRHPERLDGVQLALRLEGFEPNVVICWLAAEGFPAPGSPSLTPARLQANFPQATTFLPDTIPDEVTAPC